VEVMQAAVLYAPGDLRSEEVAPVLDAGTTLVTPENVADFLGDTLFAKYEPEIDWATGQAK